MNDDITRVLQTLGYSAHQIEAAVTALGRAEADEEPDADEIPAGDRYEKLAELGTGGMGRVFRVRDKLLGRNLAMKVAKRPSKRFFAEVQATAQLQHPGIVPVHDYGVLPDGRQWFTMAEVRGTTLADAIAERKGGAEERYLLCEQLHRVFGALAYGHASGVVHRDVKPANIMLGRFGQVLLLDWGLVKIGAATDEDQVLTERALDPSGATQVGAVTGTLTYMAPEQARGDVHLIGPATDVFAAGMILWEVAAGASPWRGRGPDAIFEDLVRGVVPPLPARDGWGQPVDDALAALVRSALQARPEARPADGSILVRELGAILDGTRARERARSQTLRAASVAQRIDALRMQAEGLETLARTELEAVAPHEPATRKQRAWARQDQATRLRSEARVAEVDLESLVQLALAADPYLEEAHVLALERLRVDHDTADAEGQAVAEQRIRHHLTSLPPQHPIRERTTRWLQGTGSVSLQTEPSGATVIAVRIVERHRQRVPADRIDLGTTPLVEAPLDHGSWVLEIEHPESCRVKLPVFLERNEHYRHIRPGRRAPQPVTLPGAGTLGPDEVFVPAGPFRAGGDPAAAAGFPATRVWVDAFVIERFQVTTAAYKAFLDDLVDRGDEELALRCAPRENAGSEGDLGRSIWLRDARGHFLLGVDADGDEWFPDLPVVMISAEGVAAYLEWRRERDGLAWRLPSELEWEKAARGADGRIFPWGDHFDASWAAVRTSFAGRPLPTAITAFPDDCSPYGVRGMAGNVRDMLGTPWAGDRAVPPAIAEVFDEIPSGPLAHRGGSWAFSERAARAAARDFDLPDRRRAYLGFRLARSY